jgi:hypothetical protein
MGSKQPKDRRQILEIGDEKLKVCTQLIFFFFRSHWFGIGSPPKGFLPRVLRGRAQPPKTTHQSTALRT